MRSDFALELDVVDKDHILGKPNGLWTFSHTLKGMSVFKDTTFMDGEWQLSLVAIHPEVLEAEKDYKVYFYTENPISSSGRLKLNMSLSVDFIGSSSGGVLCDNSLKHNSNPLNPWNYFTLEIDQFREFQYVPNASNLGICWVNHNDSGPQYCGSPPVVMCAWKNSSQRVCWLTKDGYDRSCERGTAWFIDDTLMKVSRQTDSSSCLNYCYGNSSAPLSHCAKRETDPEYFFGSSTLGGGIAKPATDPKVNNKPDFIIDRVRLLAADKTTEKYRFKKTDTLCMEGKLRNIGSGKIGDNDEVKTRFMLSKGYKEDQHGDWHGVASFDTQGGHVEPGESHTETVCVSLADKSYVLPGNVYNIVSCADRTEVDNNDGGKYQEEHESNNCTTEAAFEVEGTYNFVANLPALPNNQFNQGETFSYVLGVGNTLDQPNEDVPVSVFMSPNSDWNGRWLVDSFTVPASSLPTGGSFWRSGNLTAPSPGEYTLWACVNPNGTIPETNSLDNCKSLLFKVGSLQGCSTPGSGSCTSSARVKRWLPGAIMILNSNNQR